MTKERSSSGLPVEPIYPLSQGLGRAALQKGILASLEKCPEMPEWLDRSLMDREGWQSFSEALTDLHMPDHPDRATPASSAWRRLAFDELLASQIALGLIRLHRTQTGGVAHKMTGEVTRKLIANLPFDPTQAQLTAIGEISADLASPTRMTRLLQGDVGSGKTLVGLFAMLSVFEAGRQSSLMVPTDVLARQHHKTLSGMLEPLGIEIGLLTGKQPAAERRQTQERIQDGSLRLVVGTHALFQASVKFHDLGLAVVDEQHRFGVHQRLALGSKGNADLLVMTATPIPRTLRLTLYGDMDVSKLDEKPAGRLPIDTRVMPDDRIEDIVVGLGRAIDRGHQAYWVCPLVAESDLSEASAAENRFAELSLRFPGKVAMVHGQQTASERNESLAAFYDGKASILVATTVIEVGVDVPAATIMVIENAERFGLSQLHQLRGRVGRSDKASRCLLVYKPPLGDVARARLDIMRQSEDGFRIAEEDLRLRGGGDLLGTQQSGMPGFGIVRPEHMDMIGWARDDARLYLDRDPELVSPRGEALRHLLYLFDRDSAVRLLKAG